MLGHDVFLVVNEIMPTILGAKTEIEFLSYLAQSRVLPYSIILHNSCNISNRMIVKKI